MSQWAIDGDGRSADIFSSMKNAVLRSTFSVFIFGTLTGDLSQAEKKINVVTS